MQAANTGSSNSSAPDWRLEVSLAYQDLATGLRARRFLEDLLASSQIQAEINLTLWNLSLFHLTEIRELAVLNAVKADLVVLSLRGDNGLEAETEKWLAQWVTGRGEEECALAVLIHSNVQEMDSIGLMLFWLQQVTRSTRVRLFVGFIPIVTAEAAASSQPASQENKPQPMVTGESPRRLDVHFEGGLNE